MECKFESPVVVCKYNKEIFNYLESVGVKIIFIEDEYDRDNFYSDSSISSVIEKYHVKNLDSIYEVMKVAAQIKVDYPDVTKVISPNEFSQYASGIIGEVIGDKNTNIISVVTARDKYLMKKTLSQGGVKVAKFISVPNNINWNFIEDINNKIGFPCIIKPKSGSSSSGVKRIKDCDSLVEHLKQLSEQKEDLSFYMCEEYIEGNEFAVDAIWVDGKAKCFLLGKYEIPMLCVSEGTGYVGFTYVPEKNNLELYKNVHEINQKAMQLFGVHTGISHTEFFITAEGDIYLGEMATRMGGGPHELLAKFKTGYSLGEMQAKVTLGDIDDLNENIKKNHEYLGYLNLQPKKQGVIKNIMSSAELMNCDGCLSIIKESKPGDVFNFNGSSSWCLSFVLSASNEDEYIERTMKIIDLFKEKLCIEG